MGPGALLAGIFTGLGLNVFLKMVVTAIVALGVLELSVIPTTGQGKVLAAVGVMAVCGSLAFNIGLWLIGGLIGDLVGVVLFWLVVTFTLDYFTNVHYDQSYAYTGEIVVISLILWIIVGAVIAGVRAMP